MAVLGLADPADGDWGRLRGLQYSSLARVSQVRVVAHVFAAIAAALVYYGSVHVAALIGWFATLCGSLYYGVMIDKALFDVDQRRIGRDEVNKQTFSAIGNALVWIVPMAAFAPFGDPAQRLELWAITAMLMTASAVLLPAVPLANVVFSSIVALSALVSFAVGQAYGMAMLALLFGVMIALGAIENARSFLTARIAESAMAEKSEVVSMLLREFEEGEADWLWQIDTSRRVRSVSPRFAFALGLTNDQITGSLLSSWSLGQPGIAGSFPQASMTSPNGSSGAKASRTCWCE